MKNSPILAVLEYAYAIILRDLVKNAINDPNSNVDELVLLFLDRIFNHQEE